MLVVANLLAQRFNLFFGVFRGRHRANYSQGSLSIKSVGLPLPLDALAQNLSQLFPHLAQPTFSARQVQSSFTMRKAALLYNPESGGSKQRQTELESALAVLRNAAVEADLVPTESPYHAV